MLDANCPSILGMPFLRTTNPNIDWVQRKLSFKSPKSVHFSTNNMFANLPVDGASNGLCSESSHNKPEGVKTNSGKLPLRP